MPWITTVSADDATGLLKEAYDWQAERLGEPTEFTMLGSLYPDIVMERLRLYRSVEGCPSSLSPGRAPARRVCRVDAERHRRTVRPVCA